MTFPRSVGQVPVHYAHKSTGRPYREGERYVNRYIDESNEALYPFGSGLSYTSFDYGAPRVSAAEVATDGTVTVSVGVTNTGDRSGGTVVQLYFRDPVASRTRPVRQLIAFEAVDLAPGESRDVSWSIEAERFAFFAFDPSTGDGSWMVEPGEIVLFAGADSEADGSVSLRVTGAARRVGAPTP
jgi:beta-glucosidase